MHRYTSRGYSESSHPILAKRARFTIGAALFGQLVPVVETPQRIYVYTHQVDLPPFNNEGVVGLLDMRAETARKVLSAPGTLGVLGLTHDGRGIYMIRTGQDPSFTEVEVIAVDGGPSSSASPSPATARCHCRLIDGRWPSPVRERGAVPVIACAGGHLAEPPDS